ncbi:ABC transporter permease [Myroides sp. LJL116]
MNFPFYIAKRYAFSKSKSKAINVIASIAAVGIVVSAMAMFIVLSVFSGLRTFSLSFVNDLDPDLKVYSEKGKSFEVLPSDIVALEQTNLFAAIAPVVEDRLLFSYKEKQTVALIKGVDPNFHAVSGFDQKVEYGYWFEPGSHDAVVGFGIPVLFSMSLFDTENPFEAISIKPGVGVIENPENAFVRKTILPIGVYVTQHEDIDNKYVFVDIDLARELLSIPENHVTNLEFRTNPGVSKTQVNQALKRIFTQELVLKDKAQLNDGLYRMLNTENLVVYLIFVLVVIMALFTLVGALIMIILEKQPNIKTLYNIGVPAKDLKKVFLFQGMIISSVGGLIGVILGVVFVILQQHFSFIMIRPDMAYPIEFDWFNLFMVLFSIFILGFLASFLASSRVNKAYLTRK